MLNGCMMQLSALFSTIAFALVGFLVLAGPAIGNVFSNVVTELDNPPTIAAITPTNTVAPPTETATSTSTATFTVTPSATVTPSETPTATLTNTATFTVTPSATPTNTPTATFTPSNTPTPTETPTNTATFTPTFTPTPAPVCIVQNNRDALLNVRSEPFAGSDLLGQLPVAAEVEVYEISETVDPDGFLWFRIETVVDDADINGWVREDLVNEITPCNR